MLVLLVALLPLAAAGISYSSVSGTGVATAVMCTCWDIQEQAEADCWKQTADCWKQEHLLAQQHKQALVSSIHAG